MWRDGPNGRDRRGWSVRGHRVARVPPWLSAGLPRAGISVIVGPPFAASLPSLGPVLVRSVDLANPHAVPLSRLYPTVSDGAAPAQLPPEVDPATIVPVSRRPGHDSDSAESLPSMVVYPTVPPPHAKASIPEPMLPVKVLFRTLIVAPSTSMPPPCCALFPARVLAVTVTMDPSSMPPPTLALLSLSVLCSTVALLGIGPSPLKNSMPPP